MWGRNPLTDTASQGAPLNRKLELREEAYLKQRDFNIGQGVLIGTLAVRPNNYHSYSMSLGRNAGRHKYWATLCTYDCPPGDLSIISSCVSLVLLKMGRFMWKKEIKFHNQLLPFILLLKNKLFQWSEVGIWGKKSSKISTVIHVLNCHFNASR